MNLTSYPAFYINNPPPGLSTQYDGFTVVLTAVANVTVGETYHVKIAVADRGDTAYDLGVFLSVESLCGNAATYLEPDFNFNITGNNVAFYNVSSYGVQYEWDFGDGTTFTGETPPLHPYTGSDDLYTVNLTAKNAAGTITETHQKQVVLCPFSPVVTGSTNVCAAGTMTYNVEEVAGSTYNWTVTGGTITAGQGTPQITVQWNAGTVGSVSVEQAVP